VLASPAPSEGRRLVLQADISQVLSKLDPSPASRRAVELTSWRPNWNILGHVRTTNAVSSLELKRRDLLLKGVGPEASALLYGTQWLVGKPGIPFRHFVAQPPSPQGWVEYQSQEAPKLVRCSTKFAAVASAEEALDRVKRGEPVVEAAVPSQNEGGEVPCELARLGDASFRVTSAPVETPLLVRVSESYLPGWSATAAGGTGLPVFASDVAFVGTVAPARSTELTFSYRPPHLAPMLGVSAGSWALLAILGTVAWRQRKND
jgi:hypothetical protein